MQDRQRLAEHPNLFYQNRDVQRSDILKEGQVGVLWSGMQTTAIALLLELLDGGAIFEITMAQTGHHDDGPHGHAGGCAWDGWFLNSRRQNDWMDAGTGEFATCCYKVGRSQYARQFGAVGDGADSPNNFHYAAKGFEQRGAYEAGVSVFQDSGDAHVHLGATG